MNNNIILTKVITKLKAPKIYVDLDGVLADFEHGFIKAKPKDDDAMWEEVRERKDEFWKNLKMMPDAQKLWNYVKKYNPIILSAHPSVKRGPQMVKEAIEGKRKWLEEHFGKEVADKAIIIPRAEKANYAKENSILIDDLMINIIKFNDAGGKGIHHISAAKTIEKLKNLGL